MNTSEIKHFFMSQLFQIFPQGVIFTIAFYKNGYSLSHHYYKIKIQSLGWNESYKNEQILSQWWVRIFGRCSSSRSFQLRRVQFIREFVNFRGATQRYRRHITVTLI